jgi:hypothetical protein
MALTMACLFGTQVEALWLLCLVVRRQELVLVVVFLMAEEKTLVMVLSRRLVLELELVLVLMLVLARRLEALLGIALQLEEQVAGQGSGIADLTRLDGETE